MSGILNKKERIIDFVITNNGRSQIEDGDIRYKFATLSDKSIIYTKDHEVSKLNKSNITNSEDFYIPLENNTKVNDTINPEFDLGKFFSYRNSNLLSNQEVKNSVNFNNAVDAFLTNNTLAGNLKNLRLLTTENKLNEDKEIQFSNSGLLNNEINFNNLVNKYPTISSYSINKENLPVIALDKRFSHKNNFKVMLPKDISGQDLYDISQFKKIEKLDELNTTGYVYDSYNLNNNLDDDEVMSREKEIIKTINSIENNNNIHKKVYEFENNTEENTFIFELYESRINNNDLEKLAFIKLGNFYDKTSSTTKKIYLIGKIINSREDTGDLDLMFTFNDGKINLKNKSTFAISAYYSFITLFTLVIE
tara:strand:+ start:1442 stop:2533 length:1092 start_codon:yes stop_codon:yes gene_type:complete